MPSATTATNTANNTAANTAAGVTLSLPPSAPASARAVFALLRRLQVGTLDIQLPDGSQARFGTGAAGEPHAALRLHNWNIFSAVMRSGDIGFAETFIAGDWAASDLVALLQLFIANRDAMESVVYGTWWGSLLHRMRHLFNRNSRAGSKRNIHAHYDLGNSFYTLWLDETMTYSSAWFNGDTRQSMASAQQAKMRRALSECRVTPASHVLEIGCGWGGVAECAAGDFGARLTGVTLSSEQLEFGNQRLARAGLADRATLRFQDYRDIADGPYDAIVSIEMFEHMRNYDTLFTRISSWLKPGGKLFVHIFCHRSLMYPFETQGDDNWMGKYFFTGGLMPSADTLLHFQQHLAIEQRWLLPGTHYEKTSNHWLANQDLHREEVMSVLTAAYGAEEAARWHQRWRQSRLARFSWAPIPTSAMRRT